MTFPTPAPPPTDWSRWHGMMADEQPAATSAVERFNPPDPMAEPRTIDEARQQMVADLHLALYGATWARPEPPAEVWRELLDKVTAARRSFFRR